MDNYDNLRQEAQNHKVAPSAKAWDRVEQKLDAKLVLAKRQKAKRQYGILSSLGIGIALLCVYLIAKESNQPVVSMGQIAAWEELELAQDEFYNIKKVRVLENAYQLSTVN